MLVWICDAGAEPDKCEEVVFKNDKVALAAKAFRSVRVSAEDAELDPLLKGKGKETPRVLVIDTERKVTVLEKSKLTGAVVFDAMKKVVRDTWKEDVDAKVKAQLEDPERDRQARRRRAAALREGGAHLLRQGRRQEGPRRDQEGARGDPHEAPGARRRREGALGLRLEEALGRRSREVLRHPFVPPISAPPHLAAGPGSVWGPPRDPLRTIECGS